MQVATLLLMIGALAFNVYGILAVGAANASVMQWSAAGLMATFVVVRLIQMSGRR